MSDGGIVVPENTRRKYINTLRLRVCYLYFHYNNIDYLLNVKTGYNFGG